jgi:hypothetical protein
LLMDSDMVAYSQCEACGEQRMFLDPQSCAHCLSGEKLVESDDEDDELSQSLLRLTAA